MRKRPKIREGRQTAEAPHIDCPPNTYWYNGQCREVRKKKRKSIPYDYNATTIGCDCPWDFEETHYGNAWFGYNCNTNQDCVDQICNEVCLPNDPN